MVKVSTVALVIASGVQSPLLIDILYDPYEIEFLEEAIRNGEKDPLRQIHEHRGRISKKEEDFGDYVEELLSQPFLHPDIQQHGIQWLKSKIKIEKYQKTEREAVKVIADYAYKIFEQDEDKTDFVLASPTSQVRIRVFALSSAQTGSGSTPPSTPASQSRAG
jgi:hypothetical protein